MEHVYLAWYQAWVQFDKSMLISMKTVHINRSETKITDKCFKIVCLIFIHYIPHEQEPVWNKEREREGGMKQNFTALVYYDCL